MLKLRIFKTGEKRGAQISDGSVYFSANIALFNKLYGKIQWARFCLWFHLDEDKCIKSERGCLTTRRERTTENEKRRQKMRKVLFRIRDFYGNLTTMDVRYLRMDVTTVGRKRKKEMTECKDIMRKKETVENGKRMFPIHIFTAWWLWGECDLNIFPDTRTNGWKSYENFIECKFMRPIFFPVINLSEENCTIVEQFKAIMSYSSEQKPKLSVKPIHPDNLHSLFFQA